MGTAIELMETIDPASIDTVARDASRYSAALRQHYWLDEAGEYHRDGDEPAVIGADGSRYFYSHGSLHRDDDLPAVIRPRPSRTATVVPLADGFPAMTASGPRRAMPGGVTAASLEGQIVREWHLNGFLARNGGGPAREWSDGTLEWFATDGTRSFRHRSGGLPAVWFPVPYVAAGYASGPDMFFEWGRLHRVDGPAQQAFSWYRHLPTTAGRYWLQGIELSEERWRVLRHFPPDPTGQQPGLHPDNLAAWEWLERAAAIDHERETIDPAALAAALHMFPDPS